MPFQSEKQRRYMHANLPEIAKRWERDYANGGIASQGGMKNYLGEQPMVNAPQNWRSGPGSPSTELAYITQPEKELILRSNIHGSLQNGPNEGPSGIMSLDGQGDYTRDRSPGANQGSRQGNAQAQEHMRNILTGQQNIGQTSAVSERTRRGAVPEWVERPDGTMAHVGSAYKDTGRRGFLSKLFGGANKYGYGQTYGTGSGRFFDRKPSYSLVGSPGRQRYVSTDPRIGQVKPGYGGRILGGLASLVTGIPLIGGMIGNQIDKYKPKSYWDKLPDSEKRRLNALNITPYNEQKLTAPNVPMDSLSLQNFSNDPLTNKLSTKNYNFHPSQGGIMSTPQGMDFAGARRAMTQPGLDKFRPMTDQQVQKYGQLSTQNINRGVYDPYGIRTPSGAFSYDMNYNNNVPMDPYAGIEDHYAEVTRPQYNTLKALGQVGNTGGNVDEIKGMVPKGTFDSIQPSEWKEIFQGKKFKDITQIT